MSKDWTPEEDHRLLLLKAQARSFRAIAGLLGRSPGAVTGRYYRLKRVVWPSQRDRDAALKQQRRLAKRAKAEAQLRAALEIQAAVRNGETLKPAIARARANGATFESIGLCLGISRQAVHKKYVSGNKPGYPAADRRSPTAAGAER